MVKETVPVYFRNYEERVELDIPDRCPHCGKTMNPIIYRAHSIDNYGDKSVYVGIFVRCSYDDCSKYYALGYKFELLKNGHYSYPEIDTYTYRPPIRVNLPEGVEVVSPKFHEIYSQATMAESEKLDQIAGVGYRKSLEFLVKDYAIRYYPHDEQKIKSMLLAPVIKEYLSEFKKLQDLAKAAAWIGNDETHYVRRHNDQDIQSMKRFIRATAQYVAAELDAEEATEFTTD